VLVAIACFAPAPLDGLLRNGLEPDVSEEEEKQTAEAVATLRIGAHEPVAGVSG
jgi:hypothetical protein